MFLLALIVAAPLHLHFDASEFANAVYHVACLTGRLACTQAVYAKFWNETYNVTREDGLRFDEFRKIFEALENEAGKSQPAPFLPNYLSYFPSLRARVRLAHAHPYWVPSRYRSRTGGPVLPEFATGFPHSTSG